jgi:hypothetical protein
MKIKLKDYENFIEIKNIEKAVWLPKYVFQI